MYKLSSTIVLGFLSLYLVYSQDEFGFNTDTVMYSESIEKNEKAGDISNIKSVSGKESVDLYPRYRTSPLVW